jgi:hypothetical protein
MTTLPVMHTLWLHEVREAFRPACTPDASVWDRARAVTYLRERFTPRFRVEREAATSLTALLRPAGESELRAAGDQVEKLGERLARLATFHQKAAEFSATAEELVSALDEWCSALDFAADHAHEAGLQLA